MDLVSYKAGGLEYFEAQYGYMSDEAIRRFREKLYAREIETGEIDSNAAKHDPNKRYKKPTYKFREEISAIIYDMRSRGYFAGEIADYLNIYQSEYKYSRRQMICFLAREAEKNPKLYGHLTKPELEFRRQQTRLVHDKGMYAQVKMSSRNFPSY